MQLRKVRNIAVVLVALIIVGLLPVTLKRVLAQKSNNIPMELNGQTVSAEVPPYIENGRTMVPVRFISEALGAKVDWDAVNKLVTVTAKDGTLIKLTIGNDTMMVEKSFSTYPIHMGGVAASIKNDRTFVPVRFVAEALRLVVDWNDNTRTVTFTSIPILSDFPDGFIYVEENKLIGDYGYGLSPREAALRTIEAYLVREAQYACSDVEYIPPERPITVILLKVIVMNENTGEESYVFDYTNSEYGLFNQFAVGYDGTLYESAGRGLYVLFHYNSLSTNWE